MYLKDVENKFKETVATCEVSYVIFIIRHYPYVNACMATQNSSSFHTYQCSSGTESQQRHVGYGSSSNYRQPHRSEIVTKEKSHDAGGSRFKLSSLKGKSWSSFTDVFGNESSNR